MQRPGHDFRRFYYDKVALGENCGCAERVIDLHEAERKAATAVSVPVLPAKTLRQRFRLALARLGLTRRRDGLRGARELHR